LPARPGASQAAAGALPGAPNALAAAIALEAPFYPEFRPCNVIIVPAHKALRSSKSNFAEVGFRNACSLAGDGWRLNQAQLRDPRRTAGGFRAWGAPQNRNPKRSSRSTKSADFQTEGA